MNKYLVTGKGFVKSIVNERNPENPRESILKIEYTDKIREAFAFPTSKSIKKAIERYNLEGFVWSPFAQEPIRDQYRVVKTERLATGSDTLTAWKVEKVWESMSDASFLNKIGAYGNNIPFYDETTAKEITLEGNKRLRELLDKLIDINSVEFHTANTDLIEED